MPTADAITATAGGNLSPTAPFLGMAASAGNVSPSTPGLTQAASGGNLGPGVPGFSQGTDTGNLGGVSAIAGTVIDWSAGKVFSKTLSGNTTFTFSNSVVGKTIRVFISQAANGWGINWPEGLSWAVSALGIIPQNTTTEIVVTCTAAGLYMASYVSSVSVPVTPAAVTPAGGSNLSPIAPGGIIS